MKKTFTSYYKLLLRYSPIPMLIVCLAATGYGMGTGDMRIRSEVNFAPIITINSDMSPFAAEVGKEMTQYYYFSASNVPFGDSIVIEVNPPFTISGDGSTYSNRIVVTESSDGYMELVVWVKYAPTEAGDHTELISHSGAGAETKTLTVNGSASTTPMPVSLVSFNAKRAQQKVILEWTTASELDNSHFEIEVSRNPASGFTKVGSVTSKSGNSTANTYYKFEYAAGDTPGTYYFRLKQVDLDGKHTYSKLIVAKISASPETTPTLAPNPIKEASKVFMTTAEAGRLNILITNIEGASVFTSSHILEIGENGIPLLLPKNITSGIYFLTAEYNGNYSRIKFLKE